MEPDPVTAPVLEVQSESVRGNTAGRMYLGASPPVRATTSEADSFDEVVHSPQAPADRMPD